MSEHNHSIKVKQRCLENVYITRPLTHPLKSMWHQSSDTQSLGDVSDVGQMLFVENESHRLPYCFIGNACTLVCLSLYEFPFNQ